MTARQVLVVGSVIAIIVIFVALTGRSQPTSQSAKTTPTVSASPPTSPASLSRWADLGATVTPPSSVVNYNPSTDIPWASYNQVANQDSGPNQQLVGLLRTASWLTWGISNDQPDFLVNFANGSQTDAPLISFLQQARTGGAIVSMSSPLEISQAYLYESSDADKATVTNLGYQPADSVWRVTYKFPVVLTAHYPNGTNTALNLIAPGQTEVAEGGTFSGSVDVLGPIWVDAFRLPCATTGHSLTVCH